jgi:hypothetical protein
MVKSGTWGKLIHVENLRSKILLHCPFKAAEVGEVKDDLLQLVPMLEGQLHQLNQYKLNSIKDNVIKKAIKQIKSLKCC